MQRSSRQSCGHFFTSLPPVQICPHSRLTGEGPADGERTVAPEVGDFHFRRPTDAVESPLPTAAQGHLLRKISISWQEGYGGLASAAEMPSLLPRQSPSPKTDQCRPCGTGDHPHRNEYTGQEMKSSPSARRHSLCYSLHFSQKGHPARSIQGFNIHAPRSCPSP